MLKEERLLKIVDVVEKRKYASLHELMSITSSSESTIRGDLVELEKENKIKRLHGGAQSLSSSGGTHELNIDEKSILEVEGKRKIAQYAASLVKDDSIIYVDAGTSTSFFIEYLFAKNVILVTNSSSIAKKAKEKDYKVYVTGGEIKLSTDAFIGAFAVEMINRFNFDMGFFGTNGIDLKEGLTTPDYSEAFVKESAIKKCHQCFILADSTKFDKVSAVRFASLDEVMIITDKKNNDYKKYICKEAF